MMGDSAGLERLIRHDPTEAELARQRMLAEDVPAEEGLETAQEVEDLAQDPDAVPNQLHPAEPPHPVPVGPGIDEDDEAFED